jgi:uncharacterized membrane protein
MPVVPSTAVVTFAVGATVLLGAWLRLDGLGSESVWLDESASWRQSSGTFLEIFQRTAADNYPPLHHILIFSSINLFRSDAEWVIRLPAALLGILNVVAVYLLGTMLGGRVAGLLSAFILGTSGFHILLSQEARMYALLACAATMYAASAVYFTRSPNSFRAALVATSGIALLYSHPFGALNWLGIGMAVTAFLLPAKTERSLVEWVGANLVAASAFLPWAVVLLRRAGVVAGNFHHPFPTWEVVYLQLYTVLGGRLVMGVLLLGFVLAFIRDARTAAVLAFWALFPMLAAYLISVVSTPIFSDRYLIGSVPAAAVLAGVGFSILVQGYRAVALAAVISLIAFGNLRYVTSPRDDWRAAAAYLDANMRREDCVLLYPHFAFTPLSYYKREEFCHVRPPVVITPEGDRYVSIDTIDPSALRSDRAFVVLSRLQPDEIDRVREKMQPFGTEVRVVEKVRIVILEYRR